MGNCVEIPKKLILTAKNLGVRGNDTLIKLALELLHNESDGSIDIFNLTKKDLVAIQSKINESVSRAKEEKIAQSNTLIENVPMAIASSKDGYTKTTAVKNSDTLYIFEDNLLAKNATSESPIGETIAVPNGPKLNVQSGPAIIRTNTNGDINKNTIGLVFKKNQQDSLGKWIRELGDFLDTDEDFELFKEANKQAILNIVDALKSGQYKRIVFPKTMGEQMAKLPQRFLEELVSMLNELGVISNVQLAYNSIGEQRYHLEIEKVDKKLAAQEIRDKKKKDNSVLEALDLLEQLGATFGRLRENEKFLNETVDLTLQNAFNALKALNMTAPIVGAFEAIQSLDILKTEFPDLMIRQNRVNYISGRFSEKLEDLLYDRVLELKKRQQSINPTDALTEDEELELRNLTGGTEEQQRIAFLNTTIDGMSAVNYIIESIKLDISFFSGVNVESLTELLLDPDSDLTYAINFNDEFYRFNGADLKAKAKERAAHMLEAFAKMQDPQIFNALMQRAADELAFTENVRIDITTGEVVNNTEKQEEFDEQLEEQEESENANTEGYMVKFRTTDPISSLTLKIRKLLGECYSISYRNGEAHYNYDDIGNIQRMDALTAFAILHEALADMKGPEDFVKCVDAAIEKYPWLNTIRDYIIKNPENEDCYDEDVRNEFYRTFRRVYEQYGYITQSGRLKWLNKNDTASALLSNATNNYESRTKLTELSVYNSDGTYNIKNITKIQKLFHADKDASYKNNYYLVTRRHPYFYVKTILRDFINNKGKLSELIKALDIINGENKQINDAFGVNIGINNLLRAIGIDTNNINLAQIAPYIDDDIRDAVENKDITVEEFAGEVFSVKQASKLLKVMEAIETITYQDTEGLQERLQTGLHLTNVFQSKYMQIGSALGGAIEGYTSATFRDFEGKTRASFIPPSFISDFCEMMQDTEHSERGTEWLIENYLKCDLYGGKFAEDIRRKLQLLDQGKAEEAAKITPNYQDIPFLWLRELMDPNNNYEKRKTFLYFNCLGYMGEDADNTVGKATIENRLLGWIHSYFAGNTNSSGLATAWYRSIPFSDVDAAVHFRAQRFSKGRKYNGRTFKLVIIDECYKILEGEIKKIKHYTEYLKDPNKIEVENFTDKRNNSTKFQFFPSLNAEKDNILYIYTHGVEMGEENSLESGKEIVESREKLLKEKIAQLLEKEFDEFYTTLVTDRIRARISSIIDNTSKELEEESEEKSKLEKEVDKLQSVRDMYNEEKALKELREKQIKESLEEFFYNDFLAQLNIQPILGGEPGLYKNFEDLIKRNKQSYSSGERLFSAEVNPETGEVVKTLTQKTMYLGDFYRRSTTWLYVKDLLESDKNMSSTTKFIILGFIESYKNICTTDGLSYRTPESFKQIFLALGGKWNEDLEKAYNNLMNGTPSVLDFISLWLPIKPFVLSALFLNLGGRTEKITTLHKNSECLMTALFSCLQSAITKSPLLIGLQQFMAKHNVDVCHFHSVVKEGYYEPFDLEFNERAFKKALKEGLIINGKEIKSDQSLKDAYKQYMKELETALDKGIINLEEYNENFNKFLLEYASPEDIVYLLDLQLAAKQEKEKVTNNEGKLAFKTFPLKDYQIVQPTDDHLTDSEAINGSLASNIVPADLSQNFEMPVPLWGRSTKFKSLETQYFYNALKTQQMLDAFKAINSEYSTIEKLQAALLRKIEGNPQYGPDVIEALLIKDGLFAVPFNCPNLSNKIEALILSVFKNEIQRMKIDGGNATLVSNFGLTKDLHIEYRKDSDGKVTGIEYIEAYLPFWASDFMKDFLVLKDDYFVIDEEKITKSMGKKLAEKLLRIIGYRIPTENKYSMFPIKVKGFVPAVAGGTIILPAEIVAMSGTDFDIDKLFLMIREYRRELYNKKEIRERFTNFLENKKKVELATNEQILSLIDIFKTESKSELEFLNEAVETDESPELVLPKYLKSRHLGITEQEMKAMMAQNAEFREFMETEGYMYKRDARYVILEPDTKDKFGNLLSDDALAALMGIRDKRERKSVRNNMLIDIVEGILTSDEGSRMILKQGNFDRVKRAALYARIIHNQDALMEFIDKYSEKIRNKGIKLTFESLTNDELKKFYDDYSALTNPYTATYGLKAMKNLMDGNSLIGITAVSSSNHYKLLFCDVTLTDKWVFTITDTIDGSPKTITINKVNSVISSYTGEKISDIGSEYQAAAPDNGKDPCLGDAGLSPKTASFYLFLKDLGIPPQIATIIGDPTLKPEKLQKADIQEIASKGFKNFDLNIEKLFLCVTYLNTPENLRDSLPFTIDEKYLNELKNFIKGLMYISQIHNKISAVSRADSTNGALGVDIPSVYRQRLAVIQLLDIINQKDCPFINLNKLVDSSMELSYDEDGNIDYHAVSEKIMKTAVPRLLAAFTLGIKSGMEMAAKWLPTLNNTVLDGLMQLLISTGRYFTSKPTEKHLRAFCEELFTAMLSTNPLFGTNDDATLLEKRNYYVYAFPLKYSSFINDEAHKDIRNLNIIRRITYNNGKGIKFTSVGKIGKLLRILYVEEIFSLLENKDAEVRAFGRDLFLYCYFATGMKFGRDNFGIFFGSAFYKAMPGFIEKLNADNNELNKGTFNMSNFVDQFLLNHAELLPRIYNSQKEIKYKTEDNGNKAIIFEVTDCNNINGDPYKYVVISKSVYRYVNTDMTTGQVIYEKAKYNKLDNSFYDMSISADDIQFDKLLDNGPVVGTSTINKGKQALSAKHNYLTNTKKATFFSGAAVGADTYWSNVAARYGIKTTHFKKDYYDKASTGAKSKMDKGIANVAHHLSESIPIHETITYKLFARGIAQSRAAEGIFAIARINELGRVEGGTRVAVYDAILSLTKPVYVFDMNTNLWNVYDHISGEFKPCKEPRLLEKSAVIGSRELTDEGKQAISNILKHSMEKVTKTSEDENFEIEETDTSNTTRKLAPKDPRAQFKGNMNMDYNGHQAEDVTADNTLDAIINGERTATTRYDYNRTSISSIQSNAGSQTSEDVVEGVQTVSSNNNKITVQYTPNGKQRQIYTIEGNKIYNKEGKEVFKTDSVDRNKIFANLAIQQGRAVVIEYKDHKYVVNNRDQIISVTTGKIMQWEEENGNRKSIIEAAKTKFAAKTAQQTAPVVKKTNSTIDYWKQAKVGDIILFNDNNGRAVLVRVTKPLLLLSLEEGKGEKIITAEQWSELEGWSTDYFENVKRGRQNTTVKEDIQNGHAYLMEFEFVEEIGETALKEEGIVLPDIPQGTDTVLDELDTALRSDTADEDNPSTTDTAEELTQAAIEYLYGSEDNVLDFMAEAERHSDTAPEPDIDDSTLDEQAITNFEDLESTNEMCELIK